MTPDRIRAAAGVLRDSHLWLPVEHGAVDIADELADLLERHATVLEDWTITHGEDANLEQLLQLPDWQALTALVDKIEEAGR